MPLLIIVLFVIGLSLLIYARRQQKASGMPGGRIIYADTRAWGPVEDPLYHPLLRLTGKPDYLVQKGEQFIPVEVKSSRVSSSPHDGHIFQLAAYCLLVEYEYGVRPTYGILHYPNRTFAVDYTPQLEAALLNLLDEMRLAERQKEIHRSHQAANRCSRCGYHSTCGEMLRS